MEIRCVGVCYCLANIYPPYSLCHEKNIISCSINIGLALATGTWTEVTKDQFSAQALKSINYFCSLLRSHQLSPVNHCLSSLGLRRKCRDQTWMQPRAYSRVSPAKPQTHAQEINAFLKLPPEFLGCLFHSYRWLMHLHVCVYIIYVHII